MPELPEVETTRQGIKPFLEKKLITRITVRQPRLRLPVPNLDLLCQNKRVQRISRRAKYLLVELSQGHLLIHLGMSGHLRVLPENIPAAKHDHIDMIMSNGVVLRYTDPRRFGLWLYLTDNPHEHPLLANLGPEPLTDAFSAPYLLHKAQQKRLPIKSFIMKNEVVVGVGNIYATESLFWAGIHPQTPAGAITNNQAQALVKQIKIILQRAIDAGGTTLRDFYASDGKSGYFVNNLQVYGRNKHPCFRCNTIIEALTIAGRSSAFCSHCQPHS